jgi:hypothetical protein
LSVKNNKKKGLKEIKLLKLNKKGPFLSADLYKVKPFYPRVYSLIADPRENLIITFVGIYACSCTGGSFEDAILCFMRIC